MDYVGLLILQHTIFFFCLEHYQIGKEFTRWSSQQVCRQGLAVTMILYYDSFINALTVSAILPDLDYHTNCHGRSCGGHTTILYLICTLVTLAKQFRNALRNLVEFVSSDCLLR